MTTHDALPGTTSPWRPAGHASQEPGRRGRLRQLVCGPADQAAWARPTLLGLLALTALLYAWNLGASGNANEFYAAAVSAGTKSWKAFFFGSFDASNFITVDKPPASLWVMELSGRIFGFSSWSMLLPQALEGVGAVALLYAAVRRWSGPAAGLIAAAALAVTPVAALMFRFNNPDALLVLLLVGAAYAVVRATEVGSTRWLALAGSLVGMGFLTKMLQAVIVLPVLALVYLVAAPVSPWRRVRQLLVALAVTIAAAGWWVAIVTLIPAADRPYIGGSTNNSVLDLVFGYNGFGRLTGASGGAGPSFSGPSGILRLFGAEMGTQVSWLLPAALVGLVSGLWITRGRSRLDRTRAALLMWGGWMVVTGLVLSFAGGIIHPYYTVALAPGITGTVAVSAHLLWTRRAAWPARLAMAAMTAAAGAWSVALLSRAATWQPELRPLVAVVTAVAVVGLLAGHLGSRRLAVGAVAAALLAGFAAPTAFAIETAATAHTGSTPSAGPAVAGASTAGFGGGPPAGGVGSGGPGGGAGRVFAGGPPAGAGLGIGAPPGAQPSGATAAGFGGAAAPTSTALVSLLRSTGARWAAATVGSQTAAALELSSGAAVMSIGGFNGSDPTPTLAQFESYVAAGQVGYFVAGGGAGGAPGGTGAGQAITTWVEAHFATVTVAGQTLYDLSRPLTPTG